MLGCPKPSVSNEVFTSLRDLAISGRIEFYFQRHEVARDLPDFSQLGEKLDYLFAMC